MFQQVQLKPWTWLNAKSKGNFVYSLQNWLDKSSGLPGNVNPVAAFLFRLIFNYAAQLLFGICFSCNRVFFPSFTGLLYVVVTFGTSCALGGLV